MSQHLFVYGTLAPGRHNARQLADIDGSWQPATVRGHLLRPVRGSTGYCPCLVLDEEGDEVAGLVFSSVELHRHWPRLDRFEGPAYRRVSTVARTAGGGELDVQLYEFRG